MKDNELKLHLAAKALDNLRYIEIPEDYVLNWNKIEKMKKELIESALICLEEDLLSDIDCKGVERAK